MKYRIHNNDLVRYADNCLEESLWDIKSLPKDEEMKLTKQVLEDHMTESEMVVLEGTKQLWEEIIDKMKSQVCSIFDLAPNDRWYATYYDGLNMIMVVLVPDSDMSEYPNLYRYEWNLELGGQLGDDSDESARLKLGIRCHKLTRNDKDESYRPHKYEWDKSSILTKIKSKIEKIRFR